MRLIPLALVVVVATTLASATGCGTLVSGQTALLKPSMVSTRFKDMDPPKLNPFAQPRTKVDFLVVGIPSYDSFFRDSATLNGTVILSDVVLKQTDAFIATIKRSGGKDALSPGQVQQLEAQRQRTAALIELLDAVPTRSQKLLQTGETLSANAAKTFVGPNAVRLPGVMKGLSEATGDLKNAAAKAPGVLDHARKTSAALAGF